MKVTVWAICLVLTITSCGSDRHTIKESERDAVIDSMVALRMEEITRQAAEDLDRRRAIEVKAKTDSIVAVYNGAPLPGSDRTPHNLTP